MAFHLAIGTWVPVKTTAKASEMYKHIHFVPQKSGDQLQDGALGGARQGLALLHVFLILLPGPLDQPAYLLLTCIAEVQKGRSSIASVFQAGGICVIFH